MDSGSRELLELACSSCGARRPADVAVCPSCGAPGLGPRPASVVPAPSRYVGADLARTILACGRALEGERKQLTILFLDVKGSMALAEALDPESWHELMDRFFRVLSAQVYRHGGTVNQYMGDGIMALFGAPIAHEDHAPRACHAALALREELRGFSERLRRESGVEFAVRMGMNSGEVVVGRIGDDLHMEYTAQGHTVGLAARMEKLAEPGTIYATQHTAALVAGLFQFRDLGAAAIKGVREPVGVFELVAAGPGRTRLDAARARGLSRFVGRTRELRFLEAALERALGGEAQVLGVVGEPGVGKSRLCLEFVERCHAHGVRVYETHCLSHGRAVGFQPILALLRGYFGVVDVRDPALVRSRIREGLTPLGMQDDPGLPLLLDFLGDPDPKDRGSPTNPEARRRQLTSFVVQVLRARSEHEAAVVMVDDAHWIDPASAAFLGDLAAGVSPARILFLSNLRPELRPPWTELPEYQELALAPLASEAIGDLLEELLGPDAARELAGAIQERTGGNPFFVEEVVRSLIQAGHLSGTPGHHRVVGSVRDLEIPATVRAVLSARIDRLDERSKSLLQAASVIGKSVSEPLLERITDLGGAALDAALRPLVDAALLDRLSDAREPECAFNHPLTQEVAYGCQLSAPRARLHARVAHAIVELRSDRLDEHAALVAFHWERAGERLEAARWHGRAAGWTTGRNPAEAMRHWRSVREMLAPLAESEEGTALGLAACVQLMNLGWREGLSEEEATAVLADGKRLGARCGDARAVAMLANLHMAIVQAGLGHSPASGARRYVAQAREAWRLAGRTKDPGLLLAVSVNRLYSQFLLGRLGGALAFLERLSDRIPDDLALGVDVFGFSPLLWMHSLRGQLLGYMGRPREAGELLRGTIARASALGEIENRGWAEGFAVTPAWAQGDAQAALAHARCAAEIAEATGSAFSRILGHKALGLSHLLGGAWPEARDALEAALAVSRKTRANVPEESSVLARLAEALLGCGDPAAARQASEDAVSIARRYRTRMYECEAELARAHVLIRTEGLAAGPLIDRALARALSLARSTGARSFTPFVFERRAALSRLRNQRARERRELGEARRRFAAMDAKHHEARLGPTQAYPPGEGRA